MSRDLEHCWCCDKPFAADDDKVWVLWTGGHAPEHPQVREFIRGSSDVDEGRLPYHRACFEEYLRKREAEAQSEG